MVRIRKANTSLETKLRGALRNAGVRVRPTRRQLPGKPDFVLAKYRVVIFCDGDFWHGHKLESRTFHNNADFWRAKIHRNMERDKEVTRQLRQAGWKVFRFWEHEVNRNPLKCANKVNRYIKAVINE